MEITGRLTADAVLGTLPSGQQVVKFSIADNDMFKPKNSKEYRIITTYFSCKYWQSVKVVDFLLKGSIVSLRGRVGSKAYLNKQGIPIAELTFHVDSFKVVAFAKQKSNQTSEAVNGANQAISTSTEDDLPF